MRTDPMDRRGRTPVARLATKLLPCLVLAALVVVALPPQETSPVRLPDVRYEPSPPEVVSAMLRLAAIRTGDVVYDLGCGDGRIVISAAKEFGARGVGIDIDPERIREARENARKAGVSERVVFRTEDLMQADLKEASVVMLFLSPSVNLKILPRLLAELKPGSRVISHCHDMGDWPAEQKVSVDHHVVYYWTIPARKEPTPEIR
jgi:SAM-dependent methyltransferase